MYEPEIKPMSLIQTQIAYAITKLFSFKIWSTFKCPFYKKKKNFHIHELEIKPMSTYTFTNTPSFTSIG
jgi:hypothetical protein